MHRLLSPCCVPPSSFIRRSAIVLLALALVGCATDRPRMSGFALGDLRIVSKGDIVELRFPLRPGGGRAWRVSSYDSFHLQLIDNPTIVERPDGSFEMLMRARAREVGDTTVVVTGRSPSTGEPRVVQFDVRIVP